MTGSTAVLADAQITQLCDHRGLGRHFLAIVPNGGSRVDQGVGVGQARRAEHRDENLGIAHDTGLAIDEAAHRLSRAPGDDSR